VRRREPQIWNKPIATIQTKNINFQLLNQLNYVTHVVETEAVGELGAEQTDDVAPRTEGAHLIFHAGLACQVWRQMRRNDVAKLAQPGEFAGRWLVDFIFHALPCGKVQIRRPTFFYTSTLNPVGQQ
jgi:hypothetical protein